MIRLVEHEGWAEVRLARAGKRNALCHAMVDELLGTLDRLHGRGTAVVVLGAEGPVFCAGGDRSEASSPPVASDRLLDALGDTPVFLVAKVEGPVLGAGVALVRACPVAIGTAGASFSLPEAAMGNFPVPAPHLEGLLGRRRILELGIRSSRLGAEEAAAAGLLTALVPAATLDDEIKGWIDVLLERPQVAEQARRYWQHETEREVAERAAWLRHLVVETAR